MALYYKESGDRESQRVIVFLHGGGVGGWMWDGVTDYFQDSYCLIPDLPGHGRSAGEPFVSISDTAAYLNRWIMDLAKGRELVVAGFSLGAQILVEMLGQEPELMDYAIINSVLTSPLPGARVFTRPLIGLTFPLVRNRSFSRLQARTLYISDADFEKYYEECCRMEKETLLSILEENMSFKVPSGFKKATANLLVTVGEKEKSVMRRSVQQLMSLQERAAGIMFPGVGHGVPLADPALFHRVVQRWLADGTIANEVIRVQT
ncbi:alpha/beta hydrolase [Paenibacillus sp. 7541]|uniref:Alpha/beta hydrolase n=1 Tax=Paenibacillus campinasensis TaxID=66347 RepID=A0A268F4Y3_9BACL|nr:alpha/beta hydrolase [Paenibacillus campinasensis]PAK55386.1 alpha/beta hydrolase [Paenibacillus sp. 7541]